MRTDHIIIIVCVAVAIVICLCLAIANNGYEKFLATWQKYNKIGLKMGDYMTPELFVNQINSEKFASSLKILMISKIAGDAYSKGKLFLSTSTLSSNSIASYTVIAHEIGHAEQDRDGKKIKMLNFLRRFGRFVGVFFWPLMILGVIFLIASPDLFISGIIVLASAVAIFLLSLVIKFITISIEKDASKKAISYLKLVMDDEELKQAKKLLKDAKLTYWADFFRSLFAWTFMTRKTKMFN